MGTVPSLRGTVPISCLFQPVPGSPFDVDLAEGDFGDSVKMSPPFQYPGELEGEYQARQK